VAVAEEGRGGGGSRSAYEKLRLDEEMPTQEQTTKCGQGKEEKVIETEMQWHGGRTWMNILLDQNFARGSPEEKNLKPTFSEARGKREIQHATRQKNKGGIVCRRPFTARLCKAVYTVPKQRERRRGCAKERKTTHPKGLRLLPAFKGDEKP